MILRISIITCEIFMCVYVYHKQARENSLVAELFVRHGGYQLAHEL
jgi:hypothetical protein